MCVHGGFSFNTASRYCSDRDFADLVFLPTVMSVWFQLPATRTNLTGRARCWLPTSVAEMRVGYRIEHLFASALFSIDDGGNDREAKYAEFNHHRRASASRRCEYISSAGTSAKAEIVSQHQNARP